VVESEKKRIPLKEGLFTVTLSPDDRPQLLGSRCLFCGEVTFPERKICPNCKTKRRITKSEYKSLSDILPPQIKRQRTFSFGKGCELCNGTGYQGRMGTHEVLFVDNDIREAILRRASASEIKKIAVKNGMTTMVEDGFLKAKAGLTTIDEVIRVFYE
jgi:type II secretory ATPase GspE/PulE/Tfp pilus assembly ATPase PilB-like protein